MYGWEIWQSSYLLFTEYGEKENDDLRERFDISKDDFPVYKLFKQNDASPVDFKGEVNADELAKFVKTNSRLWIGMLTILVANHQSRFFFFFFFFFLPWNSENLGNKNLSWKWSPTEEALDCYINSPCQHLRTYCCFTFLGSFYYSEGR